MESELQIYQYTGEGLEKSYVNSAWMVGVKNYKPASDIRNMDCLERHMLTDELFVPLTEGNLIVTMPLTEGAQMRVQKMEIGCIYSVPKGLWHNAIMPEGGKIILIERPDTSADNSEFYPLSDAQREILRIYAAACTAG